MASRFGSLGAPIDIVVGNPISAAASSYWIYVPRAHIVIPTGALPPPIVNSYYLQEDGVSRFLTESDNNLLILES